ncbi:MlaD family protein [Mycobacteroides salmoniphilum]|uniref:MlaD family protein n=1 Tax=Mycobacteroides salmoniphilum TaxID=404941 RepID=UPI00106492AA|nr:MCE family protein [Mycobacteroides salmoniphilum]TDZ99334.1 mce related protein [Mycobacteroides salmoniphilum]
MPNSFDYDGRSPSNRRLFVVGVCFLLLTAVVVALMIAKSEGKLDSIVRVSAALVNVGDGLPANSDVKFRGVLVGSVSNVVPARTGQPNIVHIGLKPEYASGVPDTVTARVVPSNVFAVSSVQLVDTGKASAPLRAGAVIREDESLPTVLFQTTLSKLREVLAAVGRGPATDGIGVLAAVGEATQGRGDRLRDAGRSLNEIVAQLNTVVGGDTGPSTISALTDAADGLRDIAPDLFDALGSAVRPMQTLAEKRTALTSFLSAGLGTVGTLGDAFDHQTDRLINITTELTPVIGALADNANQFQPIFTRLQRFADRVYNEAWNPETNLVTIKVALSLTPSRTYVRADCPRYGELAGPSCQTAPEVPVAPALEPGLESMGFPLPPGVSENRRNLAPPRNSVPPPGSAPAPAQPAESPVPPQAGPPPSDPPQSAIGGNVGPVGSRQESNQLRRIVGGEPTAATQLLLGPVMRGATVHIAPDPGGRR